MHTYEYICESCSSKMIMEIHNLIKDKVICPCGNEMTLVFYLNSPDIRADQRIIDLSNPDIVHITYPDGLEHNMDPNIGGKLGPCKHTYKYNNKTNLIECTLCGEMYPKNMND